MTTQDILLSQNDRIHNLESIMYSLVQRVEGLEEQVSNQLDDIDTLRVENELLKLKVKKSVTPEDPLPPRKRHRDEGYAEPPEWNDEREDTDDDTVDEYAPVADVEEKPSSSSSRAIVPCFYCDGKKHAKPVHRLDGHYAKCRRERFPQWRRLGEDKAMTENQWRLEVEFFQKKGYAFGVAFVKKNYKSDRFPHNSSKLPASKWLVGDDGVAQERASN